MGDSRKQSILTTMKIIRYCNVTSATIKELAAYTGRTVQDIGKIVKDMVEMGVLKPAGEREIRRVVKGKKRIGRSAKLYEYNRECKW